MGRDQADKANDARHGHGRRRCQRCGEEHQRLRPLHGHAELLRLLLVKLKDVQKAAVEEEHGRGRHAVRQNEPELSPADGVEPAQEPGQDGHATDPDPRGIAMHLRQTMLGFAVTAKHVAGGDFLGDIDVDFHGGQLPSTGGRNFPVVRLRTARAIVMWSRAELLMGQDAPLVAGINPVSLAALATPEFAAAGNLWLWLPQVRGTVELGGPLHAAIQGAVLAPTSATPVGSFDIPDFDAAERSKRPFFEGRARIRWGHDETAGEIGVGGHIGWFASSPDTVTTGRLAAFDAIVPFSSWLELRAEAYNGAGARGLGGGAIGQLFGLDAKLIRSRGGWAQLNARPSPAFVFGAGYGVDDPRDADMAATARLKNDAMSVHAEWRPAGPLVFGAEVRRLRTWYETRRYANDHINLAFGFEF